MFLLKYGQVLFSLGVLTLDLLTASFWSGGVPSVRILQPTYRQLIGHGKRCYNDGPHGHKKATSSQATTRWAPAKL